jgi:hypothetical protein
MQILNQARAQAKRALSGAMDVAERAVDEGLEALPVRGRSALPALPAALAAARPSRRDRRFRALGWFSLGLAAVEMFAPRTLSRSLGLYRGREVLPGLGAREAVSGLGILAARNPAPWLWSRVAGDVMDLALIARAGRRPENDGITLGLAFAAVAGIALVDLIAARRAGPPLPR